VLVVYLKGVAMGTADAIPGVSGGTIALITGIYERLITAITALDPRVFLGVGPVHSTEGRRRFVGELRAMDVPFLVVLAAGAITAVTVVARVAHYAIQTAEAPTYAFFFGLIGASALVLYREVDLATPAQIAAGVAGFAIAFVISGASGSGVLPATLPVVFLAGMVAISAMILPGISGAAILVMLGQYEFLSRTLTAFVDALVALAAGGVLAEVIDPGRVVVSFLAGAGIGLLTVAHLVKRALEAYRTATLAFLVSLLFGTLRLPVIRVDGAVETWTAPSLGVVLLAGVAGALTVLAFDYLTDDVTV